MTPSIDPHPMTGKLISFEGPEGGGKSTQARRLAERLRALGITVLTTREPGGTPTGEIIRDLLQNDLAREPLCDAAEALLFCASRAQLCHDVLAPALARSGGRDRIEQAPLAFHRRLREGYLELARAEPGRFSLIDASAPTDDVTRAVWAAVSERLGPERAAAAPS